MQHKAIQKIQIKKLSFGIYKVNITSTKNSNYSI